MSQKSKLLVFKGRVLRIGEAPRILCGVVLQYRLAVYQVETIYQGTYENKEIVVDHPYCSRNVLSDLHEGDRVIVVAYVSRKLPEVTYDGAIRKNGTKVEAYYIAKHIAKLTSCCDF